MAPVPYFERKSVQRKKVFTSHWMTSDMNFATVKRTGKETAKKEKIKKRKKESVMKPWQRLKRNKQLKNEKFKRRL